MRSPSDTFLPKSETRSTFDLQRRIRLLLGQECFDSLRSLNMTVEGLIYLKKRKCTKYTINELLYIMTLSTCIYCNIAVMSPGCHSERKNFEEILESKNLVNKYVLGEKNKFKSVILFKV